MKIFKLALFIGTLLSPCLAAAQIPIATGEREALLANSGIARLGSAAAGLYNPAGLATVTQSQLSASGTLFQNSSHHLSGTLTAHSDSFQSIPTQLSSIGVVRGYHYAFSVFTVRTYDHNVVLNTEIPGGFGIAPANLKATGTSLLIGPSIGIPYQKNLYFGASLFLQKNDDYFNSVLRVDAVGTTGQIHFLDQTEVQSSTYELAPVLGVIWRYDDDTLLGARLKPPQVSVSGHRKTMNQRVGYFVDNLSNVSDASVPVTNLKENSKTSSAPELALGYSRQLPHQLSVVSDFTYSLKTKWRPSVSSEEVTWADSFGLSVGAEWGTSASAWAGGLSYRQNNLRNDAGEVKAFTGLTLGYLTSTEHFDSGIGAAYTFGSGTSEGVTNKLVIVGLLVTSTYKF